MKLSEIEYKIACNEMSAAQVFTQMKQHIQPKDNWIADGCELKPRFGDWQASVSQCFCEIKESK